MSQVILPRIDGLGGVNFGGKRRVLVRAEKSGYALFIVEGHYAATGARGFGRTYYPAHLMLQGPPIYASDRFWRTCLVEGRVSMSAIKHVALNIDAVFGDGTAEKINLRETLELP